MFMLESRFAVEVKLVDISYWFDKRMKKKFELEGFCSFCDQVYPKIIKHVSTRWLSLKTPVTRTLQLYQPLQSYFFYLKRLDQTVWKSQKFYLQVLSQEPFFFSTNILYKALLIVINTFREKNHYYQDCMTRFNNSSKGLHVNFSKLILLQMEISSVIHGENKKIKNQAALNFDNTFFSYFSTSCFFEN